MPTNMRGSIASARLAPNRHNFPAKIRPCLGNRGRRKAAPVCIKDDSRDKAITGGLLKSQRLMFLTGVCWLPDGDSRSAEQSDKWEN